MMRRREFIAGLGSTAACPLVTRAQQTALPVVGLLQGRTPEAAEPLTMAFQKGLSEAGFEAVYGTEEKCRAVVIASRWSNGFECPVCGGRSYSTVKTRGLFQCSTCRRQTSPIAGTIFASTHLSLRLWFRAMYHLSLIHI